MGKKGRGGEGGEGVKRGGWERGSISAIVQDEGLAPLEEGTREHSRKDTGHPPQEIE